MKPDEVDLQGARILIVDDTPVNIDLLVKILEPEGYRLYFATSGERALEICAQVEPDLVLLDVMMPGMDGFETCCRLRESHGQDLLPIIFVTARDEAMDLLRGFAAGGVDYLTKPIRQEEVRARVRTHLSLRRLVKQREELFRAQSEQAESLRIILTQIAEAIFMLDGDGRLQMLNPACERLMAASGELLGTRFVDHLAPPYTETYGALLESWRASRAPETMVSYGPAELKLRNGHAVDLALCGMPVLRPLYLGIMHDVEAHLRAASELRRLVRLDPLTQLANRRGLDEALNRVWQQAQSGGLSLSLIMLDIDHFKAYNDHYGHQQGDACLQRIAEVVADSVGMRHGAVAARYGGEEFMIVLPRTGEAEALGLAAALRAGVTQLKLAHAYSPTAPRVTISLGVATRDFRACPVPGTALYSVADLVAAADAALYRAKAAGRDRVER
ncbi:MAG: diguanylate cyclase [Gammaproteobacteria bacterium]|nr:diguanylate cyclase [Gammaproteobacteria bacterium]